MLDDGTSCGFIALFMKMKVFLAVLGLGLAVLITGCVKTVDGRTKAAVPFKKDKIVGRYERSPATVFEAAKVVLNRYGKINAENTVTRSYTARVDTRNVWVKVNEIDPKVTEVVVQVRTRYGGTDLDLAAQLEKEIALELVNMK